MAYENFYATRLGADIGSADTTIPVETAPTVTIGRLVLEARNPTQREIIEFTGVSGLNLTGVTRGVGGTTAKSHLKNALVEMNATAEDLQDVVDAFDNFTAQEQWIPSLESWIAGDTGYNLGDRYTKFRVAGDVTDKYDKGMFIEWTRGTAAGVKSLELNGTSQYASITDASQAGLDITGDYTCEAKVYIEGDNGGTQNMFSKRSGNTGYDFTFDGEGHLQVAYGTGSLTVIETNHNVRSYCIGRWRHVAIAVDVSARTASCYLDGILISSFTSATGSTAISNTAHDAVVGANAGTKTEFFNGKIKNLRVWNDIRTQTEIRDNMNKELVGNETGLVANYDFEDDYLDKTSNNNDLTTTGSPTFATSSPHNAVEYGKITETSFDGPDTTITVYTGYGYNIPPETITTGRYSFADSPHGFPEELKKEGIWNYWQPTFTGLTIGNGTLVTTYTKIGTTVHCNFVLTLGSTSAPTTSKFTVPFPAAATYGQSQLYPVLGVCRLNTTNNSLGAFRFESSTTEVRIITWTASTTYLAESGLGATTPGTWATGHTMSGVFTYEAAE